MLWSIEVKGDDPIAVQPPIDLHITQAVLGKTTANTPNGARTVLLMTHDRLDAEDYSCTPVASFRVGSIENVPLNILIGAGEEVVFSISSGIGAHLVGYFIPDEDDEDFLENMVEQAEQQPTKKGKVLKRTQKALEALVDQPEEDDSEWLPGKYHPEENDEDDEEEDSKEDDEDDEGSELGSEDESEEGDDDEEDEDKALEAELQKEIAKHLEQRNDKRAREEKKPAAATQEKKIKQDQNATPKKIAPTIEKNEKPQQQQPKNTPAPAEKKPKPNIASKDTPSQKKDQQVKKENPPKQNEQQTPKQKKDQQGKKGNDQNQQNKKEENANTTNGADNKDSKASENGAKSDTPNTPGGNNTKNVGGVTITDLVTGKGKQAKPGSKVQVKYVGRLSSNKKVFDKTEQKPFSFRLGIGEVIKGWDKGIAGMAVGGKRKLVIPPQLGYGKDGAPPSIPPNATLEFDVELLNVN